MMRCYSVGSPAPGNNGEAAFIANCPTPVDWRAVRKDDGVTLTAPCDITVALSSTQPTIAQPAVPSLLVPAGTRTKTFGVNTNTVTVSSSATIKATANGRAKSKKLVVNP